MCVTPPLVPTMSYVTFRPSLDGSIRVVTLLYGEGVVLPVDLAALSCQVPNHGASSRASSETPASSAAAAITPTSAGNFIHTHHRTGRQTVSTRHGHLSRNPLPFRALPRTRQAQV